jgi:hypothetical protein
MFFLQSEKQVSHPYKTTGRITILCIYIFVLNWETEGFGQNGSGTCNYLRTSYVLHTVSETKEAPPNGGSPASQPPCLQTSFKQPWTKPSTTHDHFALRIDTAKHKHPRRRVTPSNSQQNWSSWKHTAASIMISAKDDRQPTTHFPVALITVSIKIKHFHFGFSMQRAVKSFAFPLHSSCTDVTDQSLTFLEPSTFFGWEIRMFPVQTGFLYYFPVEISPRNRRREERRIITTSGRRSCTFFLHLCTSKRVHTSWWFRGNEFEGTMVGHSNYVRRLK